MSKLSKYSPELRDIIEQPQSKISRHAYIFIFSLVVLLIILSILIKSPDIVIAQTKITSLKPPIVLKSKEVGRIHILLDSLPSPIEQEEYIAVIGNSANFNDIQELKREIHSSTPLSFNYKNIEDSGMMLGELSTSYFSLKHSLIEYEQLNKCDNIYSRKIEIYTQRIKHDSEELTISRSLYKNSIQQFEIKKQQHITDSILFSQKAITKSQYEESCLNYLNSQKYLIVDKNEILSKERSINENIQQIKLLKEEYAKLIYDTRANIEKHFKELLAQITIWEDKYVFKAPSKCTIEWANIINDGDYIEIGQPVFCCVFSNDRPSAIAILPSLMSGKVKVGQEVNFKLDSYPYTEFGLLKGKIDRISLNSIDKNYLIFISLPNGLISTTGHSLYFAETIYGQAEIITAERRLITRIFHHLYDILTKRKEITNKTNTDNQQNTLSNF